MEKMAGRQCGPTQPNKMQTTNHMIKLNFDDYSEYLELISKSSASQTVQEIVSF